MSVSLTIRWVFGYYDPTGKSFGLYSDDYGDCRVDPVECMCTKDGGTLIYAIASEVAHLNDRNGYEYDHSVVTLGDLPPVEAFVESLNGLLATVAEEKRPKGPPQWILHTDMG